MSGPHEVGRREFLVGVGPLLGLAPLALGCSNEPENDGDDAVDGSGSDATTSSGDGSTGTDSGSSDEPTTAATGEGTGSDSVADSTTDVDGSSETGTACEPTPEDIEGPFYREGIPIGGNLDVHGDEGVALVLGGRVLGTDCMPIEGAVVEIWHATPVAPGAVPGDQLATYDASRTFRYYGQVATEPDGSFAFETLRPGWYLNGPNYRPAHVHVKVWVGRTERLTTQLYFVDDPFNAEDPWFNPAMALEPDAMGRADIELVV